MGVLEHLTIAQISETLEICTHRALQVLLERATSGRKQLSVRKPIVSSDGKIALFPRLRLTIRARAYLCATFLVGFGARLIVFYYLSIVTARRGPGIMSVIKDCVIGRHDTLPEEGLCRKGNTGLN